MMNLHDYSSYCGPGAFAAVTGAPPNDAATALMRWSKHAGFAPRLSTPPLVLAAAILTRGFRLERWSTTVGAFRTESAVEFATRVWARIRRHAADWSDFEDLSRRAAEFHQRPRPKAVQRALTDALHKSSQRAENRILPSYTVRQWMRKRRIGTWILHVPGHVLVQRGGAIVAGDEPDGRDYGGDELVDAWRVLPRANGFLNDGRE